jgi:hypothetical protein
MFLIFLGFSKHRGGPTPEYRYSALLHTSPKRIKEYRGENRKGVEESH